MIFDPFAPKEEAYKIEISCNYPGCRCKAINSHVMQKAKFVKSISENGLVLQMADEHLQPMIDGDEEGNFFMLLPPKDAMSLPIYCDRNGHDMKLFRRLEVQEMDLDSYDTYMRLSYRSYCAARAQEQRRSIFYDINPTINQFCRGESFEVQKEYSHYVLDAMDGGISRCYRAMDKKQYEDYMFYRYIISERVPLCLSDCVFIEDELIESRESNGQLSPMFVHVLPYDDRTEVLIGYEVNHNTSFIQHVLDVWTNPENYDRAIFDLMAYANNWCVSPSFFGKNTDERNMVCESILKKKITFQMEGKY